MHTGTYLDRRGELEQYFDRTAVDAWARLTSDAPVSRIRATVRAGRTRMRNVLLDWLPKDLSGCRILDAGCGTGAFATEAAARGADVIAVDLSSTLVELARARHAAGANAGTIEFRVGDFLDPSLGAFEYAVAMDSLIHYVESDVRRALRTLAARTSRGVLFTVAPRTLPLTLMHTVGRLFPRGDRAPAIEPLSERRLRRGIARDGALAGWRLARSERVNSSFYMSQAMELVRL